VALRATTPVVTATVCAGTDRPTPRVVVTLGIGADVNEISDTVHVGSKGRRCGIRQYAELGQEGGISACRAVEA
jgi:hypothetical protein